MSIISPSTRFPFRSVVVLGAAITALCAGGAGVTARAPKAAAPTSEASRRRIKPSLPISQPTRM